MWLAIFVNFGLLRAFVVKAFLRASAVNGLYSAIQKNTAVSLRSFISRPK